MSNTTYGSKYSGDLDIKEIAKLIRADIKAAIKAGTLPKLKASVKISRYAGGQSLSVTVKECATVLFNKDYKGTGSPYDRGGHSDAGQRTLDRINSIVSAYNFNGSDIMTDYFHVNFYGRVSIANAVRDAERCTWGEHERNTVRLEALYNVIHWGRRDALLAGCDTATLAVALDLLEESGDVAAFDAFILAS